MEMDDENVCLESWVRPVSEGSTLQFGLTKSRMKKCNYKSFNWIFENVEEYINMGEMVSMMKDLKIIEQSENKNGYFMKMNFGQPTDIEMCQE